MHLNPLLAKEMRAKDPATVVGYIGLLTYLEQENINLSDLANFQGVTLPTMSATISTLVDRGWVRRTRSETDRRMVVLQITPRGQAVLQNFRGKLEGLLTEFLSPLSPQDIQTLNAGLGVLQRLLPPPK